MKLKYMVDDINAVDEVYRGLYTEKDGKWYLTEVEGVKTPDEFNKVKVALDKERSDHRELRARISTVFGDKKFEDIQADLDRLPELEAQAAAGGGNDPRKIEELVEARVKGKLAPLERQVSELNGKLTEANGTIDTFKQKDRTRAIHDALRSAGTKAKLLPEAMEDALILGERIFDVDEETGTVTVKDNVGYTPGVDPVGWLGEMESKRPHWWGQTSGGGSQGNRQGGGSNVKNPFTHDGWNLTEQGKLLRENRGQAERLALAAGTTVGGPKPMPRKQA